MAWIAAAIVFCFLMWKWPRRTLKGLGICAIIGAVLAAILTIVITYQDYKNDSLKKAIKIAVEYQVFPGEYRIAKHETKDEFVALVNGVWKPAVFKKCSFNQMMENMTKSEMLEHGDRDFYNKKLSEYKQKDDYTECYEIYVDGKLFTNRFERDLNKCHSSKYPLFVSIKNTSNSKIYGVDFTINAYRQGKSTNLAQYNHYTSDDILETEEHIGICYEAPKMSQSKNLPLLEWKVYVTDVKTRR